MKVRALFAFFPLLFVGGASAEEPGSALFQISNATSQTISLKLFSKKPQGQIWPDTDTHWDLEDKQPHSYRIACEIGEEVCFGASWADGKKQWGVGIRGNLRCPANCCLTCSPDSQFVRHHWQLDEN